MKLHLPKQLFTALLAAITLAAPSALTLGSAAWGAEETIIKYDAAGNVIPADDTSTEVVRTETVYTATSTLNGVGTTAAQIGDSGHSFNLINYVDADTDASKLVIEGNSQGVITTASNNGGWGGRVTFAALASDATTYCQDVTLTKGIEADVTNIQGNGNIVLTVDNASIYGSTNNYAVTLNIGDNGVRFNGVSGSSYTWSGVVTGTGDVVVLVGDESTTLTLTGDTSSYSGTWKTSTSRVFAFGNGEACANGKVGGNVSNNSGAWYNYAGSYEVLGSINTGTIKVNGGAATFSGNISATTAMEIATGASATISGNATTVGLTNNGALEVQNGGTLSINSTITNAGSLTIADGAKLQINSLSGYNSTANYTLSGADGTYGYQEELTLTYNLVTGAGSFTLNGSVMLGETDITSSVTNGQYIVASTEKVYEITGDYTGPVIAYNGSSGDTAQADSFIVHEGASLKITDTANSNGALGKNVSGEGTLIIAAAANDSISFTGSSMADFTGTVDVISGAVYLGNVAGQNTGAAADFAASKIIVRNGAAFWTHMSAETLGADIDLLSGATLGNKDKNNDYQGNIRFNIVDPDAETASYNKDGVVTINQYWQKDVKFSGLLEGDGIVQMKAANAEANANYELSNASNTFAGTYKVIDGDNANNSGKTTTLKLSSATAAQYATIDLASTGAVSVLKLAGNSTIAALYGSDADNYVTTDATGTLTVSEGSFGGKMQNGSNATLSLTKTGSGKLTLSGTLGASGAALGSIRVNGGNLEILNTSYVTSVNMAGGNLTYGGTGVTHNISEGLTNSNGSQNSTFAVASGSAVHLASLTNAWGVNLDIDGTATIAGSLKQAFNSSGLSISGDGCVTAGSLDVSNQSKFDVAVTTLKVTGGFNMSGNSSKVTFTSGSSTTISGATNIATNSTAASSINKVIFEGGVAQLNGAVTNEAIIEVNAGSATLNGAVTNTGSINVNGGSATLNGGISGAGTVALTGGSLILGSDEGVTNEIAQFNYSGGTLSHSGLTVTNATFSGATLDNAGNGTLTLAGTLNVINIGLLTPGEGSYTATLEGEKVKSGNGFYSGRLHVITGGSLDCSAEGFELQLNGSTLTQGTDYTADASGVSLSVSDTSTFFVNNTEEVQSLSYGAAEAYHVAAGATLEFSGTQAAGAALTKSVTGTGTVKVTFDTDNHNESVQFGDVFNGELEVSGYMHLANFRLGKDATIKLASGQVWNQSATTSAYKILLAGENEESFSFIGSELTLTGKVTGTYLTTSANMNLLNAANNITQVMVKGNTTKLNAGTYGTVKVAGGTVNVTGGSVTTVDYTGSGTVNFKLAQGQSATSYTLDEIKNTGTVNYARNLTVDSGVTLTTGNLTNSWGMGTMTINGTLIVNEEMKFSTGANDSTSNNVLTGSGIVRTEKLIIGNSGKYNLSGLTLKIGSGGIIKDSTNFWGGYVMLNLGALTIEATEDWSSDMNKIQLVGTTGAPTVFNTAGHTITMSAGGISGTGELKKAGEGTLVLSGANSYTGATTVEGGTLQITEAAAVNSSAGVSMESGAGLKYTGSGTETLSTPLSGAGSFTMAGSGTLTLSGANTYTGATTVESGTLQVAGVSAINSSSGVSIGSGAELKYTGSGEETLSTTLSGAGSFTMAGTGTLTVNTRLSHTGGTTIESGTLKQADTHSVLGEEKNVTVKNGATLDVNGQEAYYILTLGGGDAETAAVLTNTGGEVGATKKQLYSITLADDATVTGDAGMCMIASNHGPATLNLAGNTLTKTGSNTFTISRATVSEGIIKVLQGKVLAKQAGDSGTGELKLSDASVYVGKQGDSTGTFELDSVNQSVKDLTFDGGTVSTLNEKTLTATRTTQVKSTGGTLSGNLTATNEVSFENRGTLNLGTSDTSGKLKVQKAGDNAQYIELSGSAGTAASMTAKSDSALARLQEDASFTIQDMTLTNTTISAATLTTQVKLQNVTATNVVLAQGKFSTDADMGVKVGMGGSEGTFSFEGGLAENESITINASTGASLAVDLGDLSCVTEMGPGKYDLSITLSGVKLDSFTDLAVGAGITFAGWLGELISASSDVRVSFSEAVAEEPPAAAAEGGAATSVTYSTGSVGTVITITGLNVPEPTTATLSLLALAALAARRRRNA